MRISSELRSKWIDGPLAYVAIMALTAVLILLIRPAEALGDAGQVAYMVVCLGLSILCLRAALDGQAGEMSQAWLGLTGGMLAWTMVEMAQLLGFAEIEDARGSMLFLMAIGVLWALWKSLPLGARFYMALFFMNWAGHVLIFTQRLLAQTNPLFGVTEKSMAVVAALGIPVVLYWLFARSSGRVQRLWLAVWIWMFSATIFYVLRG